MCLDIKNFKINGMFTCDFFLASGTSEVCIIINFILLLLMLSKGGEENSIYHAFAAPFDE